MGSAAETSRTEGCSPLSARSAKKLEYWDAEVPLGSTTRTRCPVAEIACAVFVNAAKKRVAAVRRTASQAEAVLDLGDDDWDAIVGEEGG